MSGTVAAPVTASPADDAAERLRPVSMEEAVGYAGIDCAHEQLAEHSLVLKHDRLFMLVDPHGNIAPAGLCSLGLFQDDTRILSHYALSMHGGPPDLLSAQVPTAFGAQIDLAVSNLPFGGDRWDPRNVVHIRRELVLADRLVERVTLTGYLGTPEHYWIDLELGCDFADIFEVRGWRRHERGQYYAPEPMGDALVFAYRGRDGRLLRTVVRFRQPPDRLTERSARWNLRLECERQVELEWEVYADEGGDRRIFPTRGLDDCRSTLDHVYRGWHEGNSRWETDVDDFDALLHRAADDLRALYVEVDGEKVISAGIPWYSTVFGRDSMITSLQALPLQPQIAIDTLSYLARRQGRREDPYTEEQPGKILHELRRGEMARSGEIPHVPYYGSIDATPLWLILLHETWRWTGDTALVRELLPNAERALAWIDRFGDQDGDGLRASTRARHEQGLVNQGWKDSRRRRVVPRRTAAASRRSRWSRCRATCTMPSCAWPSCTAAWADGAGREAPARGGRAQEPDPRRVLGGKARHLRARARRPEAPDARPRPPTPGTCSGAGCRRRRSRAGSPAASSIRDFFSGWGVRTLSAAQPVYNPMCYHNGSMWPHDNALLVLGMALHGHGRAALPIVRALYEAGVHSEFQRLPELYCGMARQTGSRPVNYPVSCSPQAWASGSLYMLLQALLGIYPEAQSRILHVRDPVLPDFLSELSVSGLAIGGSRVALQFRRHGTRTLANLLSVEGDPLQVRIELS